MIKTIIFDFGGVFVNLNKEATQIELATLGVHNFSDEMVQNNMLYEKGLISSEEFIFFYKDQFPGTTYNWLRNAWNSVMLDFPEHRLEFIESLFNENKFMLILLSNTNVIHFQKVIEQMGEEKYLRFKNSFHSFYLSHEIKMRKPEKEIFRFVLKTHTLEPDECLFIDDTRTHTDIANKLGIHIWNIHSENEDIVTLFDTKSDLF